MAKQVSLRLPGGLRERAERLANLMETLRELQGFRVKPSRIPINVISRGLDELETQHGLTKPKKGRKS